jgi:pilus assembly protein CpaB
MFKKIKIQSLIGSPWGLLVIAVAAAALLTVWVSRFLDSREATLKARLAEQMNSQTRVSVVVPVRDLPVGTPVGNTDFAARDVPADLVHDDVIRASDFETVAHLKLVRAVSRGRPVRRADLEAMRARDFSDMLEVGKRALTIEIDAVNSAAKMLKPGNHIDLYLLTSGTPGGNGKAGKTNQDTEKTARLLMSNVIVIATGQDVRPRDLGEALDPQTAQTGQGGEYAAGYETLTLSVTAEQAARISLAQKVGSLRAALRNPDDRGETPAIALQEHALFTAEKDTDGVQYIVGNGSGDLLSTLPELPSMTGAQSADAAAAVQKLAASQQATINRLADALGGNAPGNNAVRGN